MNFGCGKHTVDIVVTFLFITYMKHTCIIGFGKKYQKSQFSLGKTGVDFLDLVRTFKAGTTCSVH